MTVRDPLNIVGQVIAEKYRVERAVGEGGFAVVYRAEHTIWKKPVAIKFFSELATVSVDQRDEMQQAFINEGALLTELSSQTAAIVQARDVGTYTTPDGRWMPYMVLEWLEGRSLEELLVNESKAGRPWFSLAEVLRLLGPVAAALDVAHGRGIAHRDVKPPNIFVLGEDPRAGSVTVKILDFGVAKMITDNTQMKAALAKTGSSITSFTPQYGAPEQFSRSYGATGPWTDVFALALVAVEMLVGKPALDGGDLVQLAYSAGNPQSRPTPRTLGANVSDSVEAVLTKALAVQPTQRFSRAGEFWAALEAAAQGVEGAVALSATMAMPDSLRAAITPIQPPKTQPALSHAGSAITTDPSMLTPPPSAAPAKKAPLGLVLGEGRPRGRAGCRRRVCVEVESGGDASSSTSTASPTGTPTAATSAIPRKRTPALGPCSRSPRPVLPGADAKDAPDNQSQRTTSRSTASAWMQRKSRWRTTRSVGRRLPPPQARVNYKALKPEEEKAFLPLCNIDVDGREMHPMNCISWRDADTYCRKNDKRLPTRRNGNTQPGAPMVAIFPWATSRRLSTSTPARLRVSGGQRGGRRRAGLVRERERRLLGLSTGRQVSERGLALLTPKTSWATSGNGFPTSRASTRTSRRRTPLVPAVKKIIRGGAWNGAREEVAPPELPLRCRAGSPPPGHRLPLREPRRRGPRARSGHRARPARFPAASAAASFPARAPHVSCDQMGRSPLDHPRLAIIEKKLGGRARRSAAPPVAARGKLLLPSARPPTLASRLLYLRGTLDEAGLVERLKRLP
ncbi:MAG: protein kinase [Polyangiaceae bacterium]